MRLKSWMQEAVVALGARGIAALRPAFRERVALQMAGNWTRSDEQFNQVVDANLHHVWPAWTASQRHALMHVNAVRTARAQLDHFWAWHAHGDALREAVTVQGLEQLTAPASAPTVIAGTHRLGFEVALMRLSMDVAGALIYDPGSMPLPAAARRAWSRFHPQQVIQAHGAARPALRALREHQPLLVLVEEPHQHEGELRAPLLGASMAFTPLVAWLVRSARAQVVWLDVQQHDEGRYSLQLSPPLPLHDMADGTRSAIAMASRLERALRNDPTGYWWSRTQLSGLHLRPTRQSAAKRQDSGGRESSRVG